MQNIGLSSSAIPVMYIVQCTGLDTKPYHRLRIHRCVTRWYFLSCVDGLGSSNAYSFLGSTHERSDKELDTREMSNKRQL